MRCVSPEFSPVWFAGTIWKKQESCMARRVVRMHNFVWVIALCAGIVFSALVLGHAHFNKSPRSTAVITHEDSLPPVW